MPTANDGEVRGTEYLLEFGVRSWQSGRRYRPPIKEKLKDQPDFACRGYTSCTKPGASPSHDKKRCRPMHSIRTDRREPDVQERLRGNQLYQPGIN